MMMLDKVVVLVIAFLGMILVKAPMFVHSRAVRESSPAGHTFTYAATSCRAHSASLTEYGGVGDGVTSNTKAFQDAVNDLSKYADDGGVQLFVPAGKWLTGSFSLASHFTLYLDRDAVLLASQVLFCFRH